jgi:hypothetical protein
MRISVLRLSVLCIVLSAFLLAACSGEDDWETGGHSSNYYFVTLDPSGGILDAIGKCPNNCAGDSCFSKGMGIGNTYTKYYANDSDPFLLDLSICTPKKTPQEVYEFQKWCIAGEDQSLSENCYDLSEISDIPVSGYITLQAVYEILRGVVTFDANGGYFPDGYSTSTGNTSVTVFTELHTGEILPANVPLTINNAIVRPDYRFDGWYVGNPEDGKPFDVNTFSTLGTVTIKAKWVDNTIANCCGVTFNNTLNVPIDLFSLQYPENLPWNTAIELPDWYNSNEDTWGGEVTNTKEAIEKWTVTGTSTLNGDHQPGDIVYITENVIFTAVLDPVVKGISTREELELISGTGQYRLMQNIYVSGSDWTPISGFSGILNGGGHMIAGLSFAANQTATVLGFFGELEGEVDNLTIEVGSGSITYNNLTDDVYYGVFAGKLTSGGRLLNTSAIGNIISVTATSSEAAYSTKRVYVGGLAGSAEGDTVTNSSSRVNVTATNRVVSNTAGGAHPFAYAGGIAGILSGGTLTNIYSTGTISAVSSVAGTWMFSDDTDAYAGGIAGYQSGGGMKFSYASGNITANSTSPDTPSAYAGGIVGAISGGSLENSLAINTAINVSSRHPNGNDRGNKSAGRIAGLSSGTPTFNSIYGNSNLENLPGVNGEERAYYFPDLDWFWHDYYPLAVAFNHDDYDTPGFDDAYPWIDPYVFGRTDVKYYPIFYWELSPQN